MTDIEVSDLTRHAMERCRRSVVAVLSLINSEDDGARASVFLSVAIDMLRGASIVLEEERGMTKDEALVSVVGSVIQALDAKVVDRALRHVVGRS